MIPPEAQREKRAQSLEKDPVSDTMTSWWQAEIY